MSEPETPMERAAQYKRDRKARGLTQTQLAKAVGVRQATISDRETGAHEFGQEAVMALRSIPIPKPSPLETLKKLMEMEPEQIKRVVAIMSDMSDTGNRSDSSEFE